MSTGIPVLDQLVASIPAGANPYGAINQYLTQLLSEATVAGHNNPHAFVVNLAVIIGVYATCFLAAIFTLTVKYKHGSLWLVRPRHTSHGSVLAPNTMALFCIWTLMFCGAASIYLGLLIAALYRKVTPVPAMGLMAVIWIPMVLSLLSEAHGMAVTMYLSKPEHKLFGGRVTLHANWVNAVFLVLYLFIVAALIPFFALAAASTQWTYDDLNLFIGWLAGKTATWDGTAPFTLDDAAIGVLGKMAVDGANIVRYLSNGFKVFFACVLAAATIFVPAAFGYMSLLRRQIRQHSLRRRSSSATEKRLITSLPSKKDDRLETLTTSFHLMALETALVLFCIVAYLALTAWTGFDTQRIIGDAKLILLQHLIFYWVFAAFGTPVIALVAWRSWTAYRADIFFGPSPALTASPFSASPRHDQTILIKRTVTVDCSDSSETSSRTSADEKADGAGLGIEDLATPPVSHLQFADAKGDSFLDMEKA